MRGRLVVLAAVLAAGPASGQVISTAPEQTAVTVYRLGSARAGDVRLEAMNRVQGLAMIRETRTVDLPAGRSRISFRGVADTMVPQTAAVEGLPGAVIERNQDYNLLTPGALIEASIDRQVQLVRTNPKTGQAVAHPAVVRAGAGGPVLEVDGRIEALGCSGAPERLVFDGAPPGLADKPTFSVLADAPRAGRYQVQLSYLATGLAWSADYVARIAPDGRTLDLLGWVTLANQTSVSFANAPTDVVAGELSRDAATRPPDVRPTQLRNNCWHPVVTVLPSVYRSQVEEIVLTASKRQESPLEDVLGGLARQSDLGDYKLYTLPEPTTVASRQTKQVRFLDQKGAAFERIYAYGFDGGGSDEPRPEPARIVLRLQNDKAHGLGKPLPAGAVTVMEPTAGGAPVLVGRQRVKDTPVGLPLEVALGEAVDVWVTVRELPDPEEGDGALRAFEVEFANGKPVPVTLEYRQMDGARFKVVRASRPHGDRNGDPLWTLRLRPGARTSLTYTVSDND